jgi:hypothetical protein
MNNIIKNLTTQNYLNFKSTFENSKEIFWNEEKGRLYHPGEFGTYRENAAREWFNFYIPKRLEISNGFIITPKNKISTQCDIVIFEKNITPKIENIANQKFFPVESVAGIIEIKSDIQSPGELNSYLIKLSEFKRLREDLASPDPYYRYFESTFSPEKNPYDNIFTILLCNKFGFEFEVEKIEYGDIEPKYHHNLIISLNDGLVIYTTQNGSILNVASVANSIHNRYYSKNDGADLPYFVSLFLKELHTLCVSTTICNIDMGQYLFDNLRSQVI